jgi:Ca2+-binding RTX toxin-like protein
MSQGRFVRRLSLASLVVLSLAASASPAGAAVTIGSDLSPDPNSGPSCVGTDACTLANLTVAGAPTGSPINGVVVRWRVRSAGADVPGDPVRLKVARLSGGGAFTGISTSATETITDTSVATTFTFSTSQPIAAGDVIALDIDAGNGNLLIRNLTPVDVSWVRWQPPLLDGQNRVPDGGPFMDGEHMFNADVEPDCDNDGLGDETQDTNLSTCAPGTGPGTGPAPTLPSGAPATCRGLPATIVGTNGNDVRTGSQGRDVMLGLGGNDTLRGLAGNDVICGAKGNDALNGGKGQDTLLGQKGNDKLKGGPGNDKLSGKKGKDTLKGGGGNDKLKGGGGRDVCIGGKANDSASKCEVEKSI